MRFLRYAVYYTPPPGPFAALGAAWLGWNIAEGCTATRPEIAGLPAPAEALTETPGRYGFHATLRPPFPLKRGANAARLESALRALATACAPVRIEALRLGTLGPFVALLPEGDTSGVDALEARLVAGLDGFRAPTPPAVLARRRPATLSASQEANLARWGYPYVMQDFRFHLTLAGPLPPEARAATLAALAPQFGPFCETPLTISEVTLAGEDGNGRYHQIARIALTG